MNIPPPSVCAIIVTYHPDLTVLSRLLNSLQDQVAQMVIVDNTTTDTLAQWLKNHFPQGMLINPGNNIGLGAAHNRGLNWAITHEFQYALLFDQDSVPAANMVSELLKTYEALIEAGQQPAVVGPTYVEEHVGETAPFVVINGWQLQKHYCHDKPWLQVAFLITSGSLINLKTLIQVGMLDEKLFIDYVDIEWCFRAASKGFPCFAGCSATMYHSLGEAVIKLFGKNIYEYSALRKYYMFRNIGLLLRRSYLPLIWKLRESTRLCLRLVIYTLLMPHRWQGFKMALRGMWDGVRGKTGKYNY